MRPSVQYATAVDGVRIALAVYGHGPGFPLVSLRPPQWSHLEREWAMPRSHHEYEAFFDRRTVIRFDPRGTGLSDRGVADQSLEARMADLDAVVERLGLERFAIDAISSSGLVAMAYAARRPERIAALTLQNVFASGAEWWAVPARHSMLAMAPIDWAACAEAWAWLTFGQTDADRVREMATHILACIHADDFLRLVEAERAIDLREDLERIEAPVLVLTHGAFARMVPEPMNREVAAAIPGARLVAVTNREERVRAIEAFLAEHDGPAALAPTTTPEATRPAVSLTGREAEILVLVAQGLTNRAIADRLTVSVRTVDAHAAHIYAKIGAHSRAQATAYAIRHGLA